VGFGQFKDNADVLRRAADYLESKLPRLKVVGPGFVRIIYPDVTQRVEPQLLGPPRPPLDITELRRVSVRG